MTVPYTFGSATSSIPLSQLDSNFATAITLGNTAIQLGNTVTTLNNMTLANVTVSSGNSTVASETISGNLTFTGTGNRITGDFSNATQNNRVMFQSSTTNGNTNVEAIPNGTATVATLITNNSSDPLNGSIGYIQIQAAEFRVETTKRGTGTYLPMTFYTGGSERMRVDTSGRFALGTTTPITTSLQTLQFDSGTITAAMTATAYGATPVVGLRSAGGTAASPSATTLSPISIVGGTTSDGTTFFNTVSIVGGIESTPTTGSHPTAILFSTTPSGSTTRAERMRIDSSGNLLVGGTGVIYYSKTLSQFDGSTKYGFTANDTSGSANCGFMAFAVNGTTTTGAIGTITRNGSSNAVLYNTTSDQRLKENIVDADSAFNVVKNIKVRKYDWKEGGQHEDYGFIAQELAEVVNNVVSKGKTEEDMWAIDYGKLTPLLVKAIQEQQAIIQSLTARIEALERK